MRSRVPSVRRAQPFRHLETSIAAAVIHEDELEVVPRRQRLGDSGKTLQKLGKRSCFVENGQHDGDQRVGGRRHTNVGRARVGQYLHLILVKHLIVARTSGSVKRAGKSDPRQNRERGHRVAVPSPDRDRWSGQRCRERRQQR